MLTSVIACFVWYYVFMYLNVYYSNGGIWYAVKVINAWGECEIDFMSSFSCENPIWLFKNACYHEKNRWSCQNKKKKNKKYNKNAILK